MENRRKQKFDYSKVDIEMLDDYIQLFYEEDNA